MPAYILKSVSLDEDVHELISRTIDGTDEDKKNYSRALNFIIRENKALKTELLKAKLLENERLLELNLSNN